MCKVYKQLFTNRQTSEADLCSAILRVYVIVAEKDGLCQTSVLFDKHGGGLVQVDICSA